MPATIAAASIAAECDAAGVTGLAAEILPKAPEKSANPRLYRFWRTGRRVAAKSETIRQPKTANQKTSVKKYLIGFGIFLAYYLIAENLKNKIPTISKLTNVGA